MQCVTSTFHFHILEFNQVANWLLSCFHYSTLSNPGVLFKIRLRTSRAFFTLITNLYL